MTDLCPRCGNSGYGCYECTPMTDTTQEAPNRIWAGNWLADLGQGSWDIGEWRNCDWPSEGYKTTKYIRADLVQAAVAAALREAAQVARASFDGELGYDEILDLIPDDAQAVLNRVMWAERERGFWAGRSCGGSKAEIDAALAAIREGGE